ncbi:hypothetical protein GCM10009565_25710 [Amycolatopsis albidoflavus]
MLRVNVIVQSARTPGNLRGAFFAAAGMGLLAAVVCGLSFISSNRPDAVLKPGYVYSQSDRYFAKWLNRNRAAYEAATSRL